MAVILTSELRACSFTRQVRLVLPEGLELSKLYFFWLSGTLARYLGAGVTLEERKIFRENVFGISLSATGLTEVGNVRKYAHQDNPMTFTALLGGV